MYSYGTISKNMEYLAHSPEQAHSPTELSLRRDTWEKTAAVLFSNN